ncbi:MAG: DUF47 family protein [Verrucomicrobia bacterium]|nr:DUF47 family protein [Verrucomicrobiota bacterium]
MFSLQRLLGKEDKFFDLLEGSAEEARASVQALIKISRAPDQPGVTDELVESRRKGKKITEEISAAVCTTFVTALEREDIEALSNALYKIPKTVEKFVERMSIAPHVVKGADFSRQAHLLDQATETLVALVKCLRRGASLEEVRALNDKLQKAEGDADNAILELLRDLYSGKHDPLKVYVLKDLYELLERVMDRCRDAGNVVLHIILKNS